MQTERHAVPSAPVPEPARRTFLRRFLVQVVLLVAVFAAAGFTAMYLRTQFLLEERSLAEARSTVDLIVAVREWNTGYGGVWAVKTDGVETNPFLRNVGVNADIKTTDGRVLTLRNHAIMTVEIGNLLTDRGGVTLRLTGLRPLDPANAPSAWERSALLAFEKGAREQRLADHAVASPVLRYMRPLLTQTGCLKCHAQQGFKVGDIQGAISVTVPLAAEHSALAVNAIWLVSSGVASVLLILGLMYLLGRQMALRLETAEATLMRMATTDELTSVWNQRHTLERLRTEIERARRTRTKLSVVMADIDRFKRVNDRFGHASGDRVLVEVARRMSRTLRPYDVIGRIGGEEFLVLAPDADLDDGATLAERIRAAVAERPIEHAGVSLNMTLSAGVSIVDPAEPDALGRALARADGALYESKANGRDRVTTRGVGVHEATQENTAPD
jgi:diguanylate cyclase (GGDEF)-like protein